MPDIHILTATDHTPEQVQAFRDEVAKASQDPDYIVVTNFDVTLQTVEQQEGMVPLVTAEGADADELEALMKDLDRARKDPSYIVVTHLDVYVVHLPVLPPVPVTD